MNAACLVCMPGYPCPRHDPTTESPELAALKRENAELKAERLSLIARLRADSRRAVNEVQLDFDALAAAANELVTERDAALAESTKLKARLLRMVGWGYETADQLDVALDEAAIAKRERDIARAEASTAIATAIRARGQR